MKWKDKETSVLKKGKRSKSSPLRMNCVRPKLTRSIFWKMKYRYKRKNLPKKIFS